MPHTDCIVGSRDESLDDIVSGRTRMKVADTLCISMHGGVGMSRTFACAGQLLVLWTR